MRVLSLGWGVQSFTLAAMAALGDLELIDVALHTDTGFESKLTYEFAERWTPWLQERGVKLVTVRGSAHRTNSVFYETKTGRKFLQIPAFVSRPDNTSALTSRQCTSNWKIAPMRRWLATNRDRGKVEQWIGISLDEYQRMRVSDVKYITNRYPLVDKRMTRAACIDWLERHKLEVPPKSSCVFCPYHDKAGWRKTKSVPEDWAKAFEMDEIIRDYDPPYKHYLTSRLVPIAELDLSTPEEKGQMNWLEECTGSCWL